METKPQAAAPEAERNGALHAVDVIQSKVGHAAAGTEEVVRRYPLAAVGVALGAGVVAGAVVHHLLMPKRSRTLLERVGAAAVVATAARSFARLF